MACTQHHNSFPPGVPAGSDRGAVNSKGAAALPWSLSDCHSAGTVRKATGTMVENTLGLSQLCSKEGIRTGENVEIVPIALLK